MTLEAAAPVFSIVRTVSRSRRLSIVTSSLRRRKVRFSTPVTSPNSRSTSPAAAPVARRLIVSMFEIVAAALSSSSIETVIFRVSSPSPPSRRSPSMVPATPEKVSSPASPVKLSALEVRMNDCASFAVSSSSLVILPVATTSAERLAPLNLIETVSAASKSVSPLISTETVVAD